MFPLHCNTADELILRNSTIIKKMYAVYLNENGDLLESLEKYMCTENGVKYFTYPKWGI